jgi:hypothetical protein
MASKWDRMVPFDGDGNLMEWADPRLGRGQPDRRWRDGANHPCGEWRESKPFEAVVTFEGWVRGRSAAHASVKVKPLGGANPFQAQVFLTDFAEILITGAVEEGQVVGTGPWEFCKRGQNFGLRLVGGGK